MVLPDLHIRLEYEPASPPIQLPDNLYRVKHDIELPATLQLLGALRGDAGREPLVRRMQRVYASINPNANILWRKNVPEVFWMKPLHRVYMNSGWQRLAYDLLLWGAPNIGAGAYGKKKFSELYGCHRAFTNNVGFECKKDPPHGPFANFITGENLSSGLPARPKPLFCGGTTFAGTIRDGKLWVETMTKPESLEWLIQRPWLYFHATTVHEDGTIGRFPQGDGSPVLVPLVATEPVHYPLEYVEKVDHIANPYWIPGQ